MVKMKKLIVKKKNFSVVLKQAFYDDPFFFERFFLKLLWVKSKLLSRVVFLKPHIARPCVTSIPSILAIRAAFSPIDLFDSGVSFCQVSFFINFSTERPPVYLETRLVGRT